MVNFNTLERDPSRTSEFSRFSENHDGSYYVKLETIQKTILRNQKITGLLKWINAFLAAAVIITAVSIVFDYRSYSIADAFEESSWETIDYIEEAQKIEQLASLKTLEYYTQPVQQRNIFQSIQTHQQRVEEIQKDLVTDIKSKFRIIGIILDDHPQVIIEKQKSGETLFIAKGEMLGKAHVIDILESKIILSFDGVKVELER